MKVDSCSLAGSQEYWSNLRGVSRQRVITPHPEVPNVEFTPSVWVHLFEQPNPFSDDEALLLCQHSEHYWIAWVPDHGEILLHDSEFCAA